MCLQEHFVSFQNILATIYLLNIADGVILAIVCKIVQNILFVKLDLGR
jgi:hypothetical protein